MKKRLYIAAVNNRYGQNVFLPLAAGLMWSYAKKQSWVEKGYELGGMLYVKEPIEAALQRLVGPNGEPPDVLALSCYIWNWEWNKALGRAVKERWPDCTIIAGGIQIPNASPRALQENPWLDFAIYGEGERAFAEFLDDERGYSNVGSLVWRDTRGLGSRVRVNERAAPVNLDEIPSPYLEGLFDDLVADKRWSWNALQETNRGCPYSCSFCAWGDGALAKLNRFPEERIVAEFEWFAKHGVEVLYNCDANWGILKRDIGLTDALIRVKQEFGYPKKFRAAFAKNSNDTVFDISKKLSDADMLKATTVALQSMKEDTLDLIKRKNIKYDRLTELSARYEEAGIATYTELIVGLPGETFSSFVAGIDALLEAGQHDGLSIYLCMMLENTEMAQPAYRHAHAIETVPMKALLYHGTLEPGVPEEIQETVIATATMPKDDLKRAVCYAWLVQALHSFGLTQHLVRRICDTTAAVERRLTYSTFYLNFVRWLAACPFTTAVGVALEELGDVWDRVVAGGSWELTDPRFGDVSWPPEELLFLRCAIDSERFYMDLEDFMLSIGAGHELVQEQRQVFIPPEPGREAEYAREAVWYGRKGKGRALRLREK